MMINLRTCDESEVGNWGRTLLRNSRDRYGSFEAVAQAVCEAIYMEFGTEQAEQLFRLVRIFRLTRQDELPSDIALTGESEQGLWLALAGTAGVEDAWNDRRMSSSHQAIAIGTNMSPMFEAALEQIGMQAAAIGSGKDLAFLSGSQMARYFYIENAVDNEFVPAQDEFVQPFGIRSLVGFGSPFVNDAAFLLVAFSVESLDEAEASKFGAVTPFVATLLAAYEETHDIWS